MPPGRYGASRRHHRPAGRGHLQRHNRRLEMLCRRVPVLRRLNLCRLNLRRCSPRPNQARRLRRPVASRPAPLFRRPLRRRRVLQPFLHPRHHKRRLRRREPVPRRRPRLVPHPAEARRPHHLQVQPRCRQTCRRRRWAPLRRPAVRHRRRYPRRHKRLRHKLSRDNSPDRRTRPGRSLRQPNRHPRRRLPVSLHLPYPAPQVAHSRCRARRCRRQPSPQPRRQIPPLRLKPRRLRQAPRRRPVHCLAGTRRFKPRRLPSRHRDRVLSRQRCHRHPLLNPRRLLQPRNPQRPELPRLPGRLRHWRPVRLPDHNLPLARRQAFLQVPIRRQEPRRPRARKASRGRLHHSFKRPWTWFFPDYPSSRQGFPASLPRSAP